MGTECRFGISFLAFGVKNVRTELGNVMKARTEMDKRRSVKQNVERSALESLLSEGRQNVFVSLLAEAGEFFSLAASVLKQADRATKATTQQPAQDHVVRGGDESDIEEIIVWAQPGKPSYIVFDVDPMDYPLPDPAQEGTSGSTGSSSSTGASSGGQQVNKPPYPYNPNHAGAQDLKAAADTARAHNLTECNFSTAATASSMGFNGLDGKLANEQVKYMQENWRPISAAEAQSLANQGVLVVGGLADQTGHGHTTIVVPGNGEVMNNAFYPNVEGGAMADHARQYGDGTHTSWEIWRHQDAPKVQYYTPLGKVALA